MTKTREDPETDGCENQILSSQFTSPARPFRESRRMTAAVSPCPSSMAAPTRCSPLMPRRSSSVTMRALLVIVLLSSVAEAFRAPPLSTSMSPPPTFSTPRPSGGVGRRPRRDGGASRSSYSSPSSSSRMFGIHRDDNSPRAETMDEGIEDEDGPEIARPPQVMSTGHSGNADLPSAISEALAQAMLGLPPPDESGDSTDIDLVFVSVSSLYDGRSTSTPISVVVPNLVLECREKYGRKMRHLVGCTAGGIVSSTPVGVGMVVGDDRTDDGADGDGTGDAADAVVVPLETEGLLGVSVTLCLLPDVEVKTFHVESDDVPDDVGRVSPRDWLNAVGLRGWEEHAVGGGALPPPVTTDEGGPLQQERSEGGDVSPPSYFLLLPSPSFQNDLDDFLGGLSHACPGSVAFGGVASTVSSLSRSRLFRFEGGDDSSPQDGVVQTLADGCVGVVLRGDVEVRTFIAQGAKPVGGVYRVVTGEGSTIGAIVLDEATGSGEAEEGGEWGDDDDDDGGEVSEEVRSSGAGRDSDVRAKQAAAYEQARIPKPVLAEANYLLKTILSDDDAAFMRRAVLIGIERGGSIGRTPSELERLSRGKGHRFAVHRVASAGMKDGSVTLPLGCVDVQRGQRVRFFVREGDFAKREVEAIWTGYKKKILEETFSRGEAGFTPTGCLVFPTLDRGTKLFGGKPGYESGAVASYLPGIPSISGLYCNGVLGTLDGTTFSPSDGHANQQNEDTMLHGSATCFAVVGSRSKRPIFSPAKAETLSATKKDEEDYSSEDIPSSTTERPLMTFEERAPRSIDGELILKRREVHSGRAISVSTVEWSVAENKAMPTSALEGFMWDKETEVDRFRERVPLANLLSQVKLASFDNPRPLDWVAKLKKEAAVGGETRFVIIPECKRSEPTTGSLRKRYNVSKLAAEFRDAGSQLLSVNCDNVMFGGSTEDVTTARTACPNIPIMASDLLLYPYQLYKLRLAGADAVNLVVGALAGKDLMYLTKIASSVGLQSVMSVTSEVQISSIIKLARGSVAALVVSNRNLEDYSFDQSGEQALSLLRSEALEEFRRIHGEDIPVLVEGRVGVIEKGGSTAGYISELKKAGAFGAIMGGALAIDQETGGKEALHVMLSNCQ